MDISSYKHQETSDYDQCIKSIFNKNLIENVADFNTKDVRV